MIALTREEAVAVISIDRPERRNALTVAMVHELTGLVRGAGEDPSVSAIVVTGRGGAFCAGQDLADRYREPGAPPPDLGASLDGAWNPLIRAIRSAKPVVTAVNGVAAGAGMSVALACDMRIGSEKSRFKVVFPERSLSPDTGMSYYLPRIVGYSRACDLIYTSRYVEAEEAFRIGLLDRLVPSENLMDEALKVADQIVSLPPMAMQAARRVLQQSMELAFDTQL
ncbi:MAG: enoyl-CoA hydratase/isomerase family protein, partial [Actinobacteria bacterium]